MKKIILVASLVMLSFVSNAQYKMVKEVDGVQIYFKLIENKRAFGEMGKMIRIRLKNTNDYPIFYKLSLDNPNLLSAKKYDLEIGDCLRKGQIKGKTNIWESNKIDISNLTVEDFEVTKLSKEEMTKERCKCCQ